MTAGQMRLDLWPARTPGECPDEARAVDVGGGKSFCAPWGCWTNCREVGYCVFENWRQS